MNARALLVLGLAVLLVSACDEEGGADGGVDAGQLADSGLVDAGGSDGGSFDGGPADGGPTDGGSVDGGAVCGDGVVQAPEICDGDCPTDCDDDVACTADTLTGSAETCDAVCSFDPIELCQNGDGCCPSGCNATNDDDCSATCGNGTVEEPEICDGDCPTDCNDGNACTTDTLVGSAESCSAECSFVDITMCVDGDGCCPSGCDATNDDDCSPVCGNGVVEGTETCDGDCPTSCNDGLACTTDMLVGSAASCDAVCSFVDITTCTDGDGCCAAGCDATNDDDCSPTCGNGVVEGSETCDGDCPTSCDDGMVCTADTLVGSAESCSAECSFVDITACTNGDGCCAPGCDALSDDDCLAPVVGGVSPTSVVLGSPLQVTGAALGAATEVTIGGISQTFSAAATVLEIATVDETTPLGAGRELIVTTPDGTSAPVTLTVLDHLAVLSATTPDATTVQVRFLRALDPTTVEAADFTIPGLTVDAATVSGSTVTLTTSMQTTGTPYTVTAAGVTDTLGNGLTGNDSASFIAGAVNLTNFASGVTAANHPDPGAYGIWYDAHDQAFADAATSRLEGLAGMRIDDGGYTNGVYAIFDGVVPSTGDYRVEVRMHAIEVAPSLNGIRAYQIGVATGAAAMHRPRVGGVAPLPITGDYATMTEGDDTALGPITATTPVFSATAGDDVLIGFGTGVTSSDWNQSAGVWGDSYVLVGDVILVPVP